MNRLKIMERLSLRVSKIASQIITMNLKDRLTNISDLLENMFDIDKDIKNLIEEKHSSIDHSEVLKNLYDRSADILSIGNQALFSLKSAIDNKDKNLILIKKKFFEIKNQVLKTISKLDIYHKLHLNPKFHFHELTTSKVNIRMNELRSLIKRMNIIR